MTPNMEKALQALMTHKTKREAAEAVGLSPRTITRYFDDSDFQKAYRRAFSGMVEDATRQAQQSLTPALSVLREIIEDKSENTANRIRAVTATLEYATRMTEQLDIIDRLKEIEGTDDVL